MYGMHAKRKLVPHPSNPLQMLVPLANDKGFAVVDIQDAEEVGRHNWSIFPNGTTTYAFANVRREDGTATTIKLHRFIAALAGLDTDETVDHVNHDGLDCRRSNLRPATYAQNACNTRLSRANTSGVKGVTWSKSAEKWQAQIRANGEQLYLGVFADLAAAGAAVATARAQLHGAFANHGQGVA